MKSYYEDPEAPCGEIKLRVDSVITFDDTSHRDAFWRGYTAGIGKNAFIGFKPTYTAITRKPTSYATFIAAPIPFEEDISAMQRKACRGDRNAQRDLQLAQSRRKRRKK